MANGIMKLHGWTAIFVSILLNINKQQHATACGQLQNILESRITFGHDTHRWPWHAAIYHQSNETDFIYQCGGTLVHSKFVLTAAHCVSVGAERIAISLGRLYLNASHNSAPIIKVAKILVHPSFSPENNANDIAIITLVYDVFFNSYVQPVCMWRSSKIDLSEVIGKFGTVVGWGLKENGERPNVLQEASLPVVPSFKCLESNRDLFGRFLTSANFCAGTQNGTSICGGDSGGSITFEEDGRFYIRGIVSVSASKLVDRSTKKFMCDSMQYAVFTDVAQYLPWIRETIECETVVQCDWSSQNDTCIVVLKESGCKVIFDENSNVATAELHVGGDRYAAVPDLSNAVDKFMNLKTLQLLFFNLVDGSALSPFKNIVELVIRNFQFSQIDSNTFVDLNNLEDILILESNLITLPDGIFRNNSKIRNIYIYSNQFLELHSDVFENLRDIDLILLVNNRLVTLPANIFLNNGKLTKLRLNSNLIRELNEDLFIGLTNVQEIDLSDNRIEYLPSGLFRGNANLTLVFLANNRIKKIDVDLTSMPQLFVFRLDGNDCISETFDLPQNPILLAEEKIGLICFELALMQVARKDCIGREFQIPRLSLSEANEKIRRACSN